MASPNLLSVSTVNGKSATLLLNTTATAIVTNAANSNSVYKINILTISNVDNVNACAVIVDLYRSNVAYRMSANISIPVNTSFTPIDKSSIYYLEEGDSLRLTANAANKLEATCSYEVLS